MLKLLFIALALLAPFSAFAGEISDFDIATYSLTGKDGQPSGMQMRLSRLDGKWVMEGKGKESTDSWKNISCDSGCEYRVSTNLEQEASCHLSRVTCPSSLMLRAFRIWPVPSAGSQRKMTLQKGAMHLFLWSPGSLYRCLCNGLLGLILNPAVNTDAAR